MIRFDLQDVGHGDALTVKTTKTTAVCGLVKSSLSMTAEYVGGDGQAVSRLHSALKCNDPSNFLHPFLHDFKIFKIF